MSQSINIESICDQLCAKDQILAEVIDIVGPCTLAPGHAAFDFLCDSIVRQQLSKHAANTIINRFHELFDAGKPTPKQLLALPKQAILDAGISNRKYGYVLDLARRTESQQLNFSTLHEEDDSTIRRLLTEVKGIGDWTVDMYLLFGLGRIDVFPVKDLALRKSMSSVYGLDVDDLEGAEKIAEKWKPYRSIASRYLYKHGDLPPPIN
ncbi:MAG: DNA-3-methyladenine glycosylase 2 family protein [Candidatus Poribacteria bacterium]|nr:DNA-3-methyladenine glycosylase 2 family protein [Candidatus Poribacteria bacterium]